jgi:hypothetical protein
VLHHRACLSTCVPQLIELKANVAGVSSHSLFANMTSALNVSWKLTGTFNELSLRELYEILKLRSEVHLRHSDCGC